MQNKIRIKLQYQLILPIEDDLCIRVRCHRYLCCLIETMETCLFLFLNSTLTASVFTMEHTQ